MKKKMLGVLLGLIFWAPFVWGAENIAWDSVGGTVAQKASINLNLKIQRDFSSRADALGTKENKVLKGTVLPYLISVPKPIRYPRWARRQGVEGVLVLSLEVLENGGVGRWWIIKSTGNDLLDKNAVEAVRTWKFHPLLQNGQPVKTYIQIPINFELMPE